MLRCHLPSLGEVLDIAQIADFRIPAIDGASTGVVFRLNLQQPTMSSMNLFRRNPLNKLKKNHRDKMAAAMRAMQKGDIRQNALLYAEADILRQKIEELEAQHS